MKKSILLVFPIMAILLAAVTGCTTSDGGIPFKTVTLNEFFPNLIVKVPLSVEIPKEYEFFAPEKSYLQYYWMPAETAKTFQQTRTKPDIGFFEADLNVEVRYDAEAGTFTNIANNMSDTNTLNVMESTGIKVLSIESTNVEEYPLLIVETEAPYTADTTRKINFIYVASLVDKDTVLMVFYFSHPEDAARDKTIWEHFKSSFKKTR